MRYFMGIDNGGTFSKAALFDENGNQIAVASIFVPVITPKSGYTERDMETLWQANVQVIREVVIRSKVSADKIAGVSFSGHGKGLYMVDKAGKPVYNGILSTDTRAWKFVKKWEKDGTKEKVYEKTFQDILVCQPVSILAWFQQEKPEILSKVQYIFSVKDYIRFRLTQEACAEYTDFSGGNLINLNTKSYDKELLECFGIGTLYDKFPPLKESADICGYITKEAADLTGLIEGTPVAAGMFDVNACGIASGLDREEKLCMIAGTWSINEFICKHPIINGTVSLNSMFCIPGYYLVEESSPTSAGNMEWFIRNLMSYEKTDAQQSGRSIYDITNKWVEQIEPENNQLIFLPFLNGSNVAPLAKGSFVGLTAYHGKEHMLRAVYEGIAFSSMHHVYNLKRSLETYSKARLSGGISNSEVWSQMLCDALQIPIETLEAGEPGAKGAAMCAGVAGGVFKNLEDAVEHMVHVGKVYKPRSEYKEIYAEKFARYEAALAAVDLLAEKLQ